MTEKGADEALQSLIGEVARRHNVLVDANDPILITVTLNQALMADHLRKVQAAVAEVEATAERAAQQHIEAAKRAVARLSDDAAKRVAGQMKATGSILRGQLEDVLSDALKTALEAADRSAQSRKVSERACIIAAACACLVGALTAVVLVRCFLRR